MPIGSSLIGQQPLGNWASVQDANLFAFQEWQKMQERCVVQRIVIVGENCIHICSCEDLAKDLQRIPRDSHKTCFALLLDASQRRQCFPNDLIQGAVFIVVGLDEIDVVHAQPGEAFIHTPSDALGREVKIPVPISSDFCSEKIAITRYASQGFPKNRLSPSTAIEGSDINQVDAKIKSRMNRSDGLLFVNRTEHSAAKRRRTKSKRRYFQTRFAQRPVFQKVAPYDRLEVTQRNS